MTRRARAGACVATLIVAACGRDAPAPGDAAPHGGATVRLAAPGLIERVTSAAVARIAAGPPAEPRGATLLEIDGRAHWRYFLLRNELSDGPVVVAGGAPPDELRKGREEPTLPIPPGFGAAFPLSLPPPLVAGGERPLFVAAEGTFEPGALGLAVAFVDEDAPLGDGRIVAGTLRATLARALLGRLVAVEPSGSGRAAAYVPVPAGAKTALLLATAPPAAAPPGGSLARVEVRTVAALDALLLEGRVDERLVATVEQASIVRPALVVPPGARVTTSPIVLEGRQESGAPGELRFAWTVLGGRAREGAVARVRLADEHGHVAWERALAGAGSAAAARANWIEERVPFDALPDGASSFRVAFEFAAGADGVDSSTSPDASDPPLLAFGAPRVLSAPPSDPPPNVVLISLDTLRADRLGCLGNARRLTPRLDELAQDAATFERAYAHAPFTLPSHATLFTGLLPSAHGVEKMHAHLPPGATMLAEHLARAGFECASFNAGGYLSWNYGFDRGFDLYGQIDPIDVRAGSLGRALAFVDANRDRPFFLFLHTFVVHTYLPPEPLARAFGLLDPGDPPLTSDAVRRFEPQRVREQPLDDADARRLVDAYDATVAAADAMVGEVVDALRDRGVLERTLLVVTSDHGQELLERGSTGHGVTLYDEVLRVPLLVRGPGVAPGRIASVVGQVDVLPTVLELAGLAAPQPLQGESLVPLLRRAAGDGGVEGAAGRVVVAEVHDPGVSLRECIVAEGFKFIRSAAAPDLRVAPLAREELYDLANDPGERRNLAGERPDLAAALRARLERILGESHALRERLAAAGAVRTELTPELERRLGELGYLGR